MIVPIGKEYDRVLVFQIIIFEIAGSFIETIFSVGSIVSSVLLQVYGAGFHRHS